MKNVTSVDDINKILASSTEVNMMINKILVNKAMGLPVDEDKLKCLKKYLIVIRYLLLKAFQVLEVNRFMIDCETPIVCEELELVLIQQVTVGCLTLPLSVTPTLVG